MKRRSPAIRRVRKAAGHASRAARLHGGAGLANLLSTFATLRAEPDRVSSQVVTAVIEPTLRCNLDCPSCSRILRERTREEMSLERLRTVLDQLPRLQQVLLQGVGEPILAAHFDELLAECKRRGLFVYFHCNGTRLDEERAERLLRAGPPDLIRFSLDGASREVFERARRGAELELFRRNVSAFVARVGRRGPPRLEAWTVVSRLNLDELPRIVELAAELGLRQHAFQGLHRWGRPEGTTEPVELLPEDLPALRAGMSETERVAGRVGSALRWQGALAAFAREGAREGPSKPGRRRCQWPWYSTYVTVEGLVTPCCVHGSDPRRAPLGDLKLQGFEEIWNGPAYQAFRRALRDGPEPEVCRGCPAYFEPPLA
jgi:MoaA/NifB/PqqE/SkfB family radical SAM enzyme